METPKSMAVGIEGPELRVWALGQGLVPLHRNLNPQGLSQQSLASYGLWHTVRKHPVCLDNGQHCVALLSQVGPQTVSTPGDHEKKH